MPNQPRITIEDAVLGSQTCAICGEPALRVAHVDKLPDYVSCGSCGSVFVMEEGGDRVMYGKIPADFPITSAFALRQWLQPELVRVRAMDERPQPESPGEEALDLGFEAAMPADEPQEAPSLPPRDESIDEEAVEAEAIETKSGEAGEPAARFQALLRSYEETPQPSGSEEGMAMGEAPVTGPSWENLAEEFEIPEPEAPPAAAPGPALMEVGQPAATPPQVQEPPAALPAGQQPLGPGVDPPAGSRYNVQIRGYRLRVPKTSCAHCLRMPATRSLAVLAPAPPGAQRRVVRLNLPLCQQCFRRANARNREESSAKLQAHLISALVALMLVITAGVGLWSFLGSSGIRVLVLLILAVVGYGIPAFFLLGRSTRFPTPTDALFVRSTLIVQPMSDPPGLMFSWRNKGSAELFFESNNKAVEGPVVEVADPIDADEASEQSPLPGP
jgi:hypothetical protein